MQVQSLEISPGDVRASAHNNRVVDVIGLRSQTQRRKLMGKLALAPLKAGRPRTVWTEGSFLAEFGDAFLEGTGLEVWFL